MSTSLFDILRLTNFLRSALNMFTEYEQAKQVNDCSKMVWLLPQAFLPLPLMALAQPMLPLNACGNGYQTGK
jgi:hypothetical protein